MPEGVEVAERLSVVHKTVELASEHLHPKESEDHDEQEEKDEKTGNRSHGVDQRNDQIPEGSPVSARFERQPLLCSRL